MPGNVPQRGQQVVNTVIDHQPYRHVDDSGGEEVRAALREGVQPSPRRVPCRDVEVCGRIGVQDTDVVQGTRHGRIDADPQAPPALDPLLPVGVSLARALLGRVPRPSGLGLPLVHEGRQVRDVTGRVA
ncbi:hypothetical protein [Streptomyces sp. TLI_053]|uniref:hypothetical protein n=1 Tax=Streptomyces sp. TLI_053 TaxID=1855352 RepID=UPI0013520D22|nr:hypothetical protein [Streptomyces sp. TLI_053]